MLIGLNQQVKTKRTMPQVCHSERSVSGVEDPSTSSENLRFSSVARMTDRCRVHSADYAELDR